MPDLYLERSSRALTSFPLHAPLQRALFFFCERLSASMARSLHLSFICIPQSTRALDQGGVEPRQAVSPKALRPWTIPLRYSVGCTSTACARISRSRTGLISSDFPPNFGFHIEDCERRFGLFLPMPCIPVGVGLKNFLDGVRSGG